MGWFKSEIVASFLNRALFKKEPVSGQALAT